MKLREPQRVARILVLGDTGVGKTALIVRCLTRRFLPEYVSGFDSTHIYETQINEEKVQLELVDSSRKNDLAVSLADAFIIVYSIVSRESFAKVLKMIKYVRTANTHNAPVAIVANKADLGHVRKVSRSEGAQVARELKASLFCELSVANDVNQAQAIFHELYKRILKRKEKMTQKVAKQRKFIQAVTMMRFVFFSNKHSIALTSSSPFQAIKDTGRPTASRRGSILSRASI